MRLDTGRGGTSFPSFESLSLEKPEVRKEKYINFHLSETFLLDQFQCLGLSAIWCLFVCLLGGVIKRLTLMIKTNLGVR